MDDLFNKLQKINNFWIVVVGVVTPCGLVSGFQCFRGTYYDLLHPEDEGDTLP
jgi:hypothetical protein